MPSSTRTVIARAARIKSTARSTSARSTSACRTQSSTGTSSKTSRTWSNPSVCERRNSASWPPRRRIRARIVLSKKASVTGRILLDLVDEIARVAEAVGEPGIAADGHEQVAVFDVLGGMGVLRAEEKAVDPEVARLLLREGTVVVG